MTTTGQDTLSPHPHGPAACSARSGLPAPAGGAISLTNSAKRDGIATAAALHEAEDYLGLVAGSWWALALEDRAVAVRHAIGWLTVLHLGSPARAAVWLDELALAAVIRKSDLRHEVENRAAFWRSFNDFAKHRREETVGALCQMLY
jgi:hypothetical protein